LSDEQRYVRHSVPRVAGGERGRPRRRRPGEAATAGTAARAPGDAVEVEPEWPATLLRPPVLTPPAPSPSTTALRYVRIEGCRGQ